MTRRTIANVALGAILGAVFMMGWQGRELNHLYLQHSALKIQYDDLEQANIQLSAQLHEPTARKTLQSIRVSAEVPDTVSELRVNQLVKSKLAFLQGRQLQVFTVDPALPSHLLDGQVVTVDEKQLVLRVTSTILIDETLYLQVKASIQNPT